MSNLTRVLMMGAAGAAAVGPVYVDDVFSTYLYEGTNTSTKTITNGIDLAGEGGLVWIKGRTNTNNHFLFDTERGVTKQIASNLDLSESTANSLTSFTSTGFVLGDSGNTGWSGDFASWSFRKAPGFFDVVTYTGTGGPQTIAHNLGSVPGMILVKRTDSTAAFYIYHRDLGNQTVLHFDSSSGATGYSAAWNSTSPTSTHFTVGTDSNVSGYGGSFVAYIFAHDDAQFGTDENESIIKCGTYTGNGGSASSTNDINLEFEPQWILIKSSSNNNEDWIIADTMRGSFDPGSSYDNMRYLRPNLNSSESGTKGAEPTSTGFKVRGAFGQTNGSGQTYIYMAIRRPNKPPEVGTDVFAIDTRGGTSPNPPTFNSGFPVDLVTRRDITTSDWTTRTRLLGENNLLQFNTTAAENTQTSSTVTFDQNDGVGSNTGVDGSNYAWMFKRAPGFMDVVAYTGTGSAPRILSHNLAVTPELLIVKKRSGNDSWLVAVPALGTNQNLLLNNSSAAGNYTSFSAYSASTITLHSSTSINASGGTYISYLFATLPGISKVGSFSGTGYAINVDCGFTNGARFVLIKRTDADGDWYVWNTVSGIVSGNDPYLLLNTTDAEVANTDYIDPLSSGFTVTSSAPAALNASGGTYIFLAIA